MTDKKRTEQWKLDARDFDALLTALREAGFGTLAPTIRDGALAYAKIDAASSLPVGQTINSAPARVRIEDRSDRALFGYAVGQDSWKRYFLQPRRELWRVTRNTDGLSFENVEPAPPPLALIGVRPCEVAAIRILDKVFVDSAFTNEDYCARREQTFIVAVNCGAPSSTCFCPSFNTGPRLADTTHADLVLTEVLELDAHWFLIEVGSERGAALISQLPIKSTNDADLRKANAVTLAAEKAITRRLDTDDLPAFLSARLDHPVWDEVAARCLACANCTSVCPTCFCTTVEDATSLDGAEASRAERWDSCFTSEFSELGRGPVRTSTSARYRQWMTHKLGTWSDQFGSSGCVGCGRCIAWCPVGIDITEEVERMQSDTI